MRERKTSRRLVWIVLAVVICVLFFVFEQTTPAFAYTQSETAAREELSQNIRELLDALDTDELQTYLQTLSGFEGTDLKEILAGLIDGDLTLDYNAMLRSVLELLLNDAKILLPAFVMILAASLLCGVLNAAKNDFLRSTMSDIINFVAYIAVGGVVLACLLGVLRAGFEGFEQMQRQMQLVYPVLLTLMSGSGGAVSAGIFRPAVVFMSGAVCELFSAVVLPVGVVVIVLSFVGNLTAETRAARLGEFFKSACKWLIGLTLGLFTIFLTVQGIAAAQYDGISLRAAKYLVSGSVPMVGGFLSGGLDLVLAGSALIKNALGSYSVFLLFATLLRPVALFVCFQLFLRLCAALTEPAGGKISAFLSCVAKDSSFFLAGLLCIAFLYFLTVVLLVCTTGVIF